MIHYTFSMIRSVFIWRFSDPKMFVGTLPKFVSPKKATSEGIQIAVAEAHVRGLRGNYIGSKGKGLWTKTVWQSHGTHLTWYIYRHEWFLKTNYPIYPSRWCQNLPHKQDVNSSDGFVKLPRSWFWIQQMGVKNQLGES